MLRLKDWLQLYGVSVRFAPDNFYATNIYNFCHILCVYQCIHFIPIYQYISIFINQQTHFDGWMLCLTSSYDQCPILFKNNTKREAWTLSTWVPGTDGWLLSSKKQFLPNFDSWKVLLTFKWITLWKGKAEWKLFEEFGFDQTLVGSRLKAVLTPGLPTARTILKFIWSS